jgi:replicative DNA helicase
MINSLATETGTSADLHGSRRRQPALADSSRVDRLPPHSLEAEQGVLGCVLLSPNECLGEYIQKFKDTIGAFYDLRHQCIMEALVEMYDTKEAIDLMMENSNLIRRPIMVKGSRVLFGFNKDEYRKL